MTKKLEKRIERLENILIEIATRKERCKYPYLTDIKQALEKHNLLKKKKKKPNKKKFHAITSKQNMISIERMGRAKEAGK